MVAQIKGTRRNGGRCNKENLKYMYKSVKDMFDFDAVSNMRIKYRKIDQQSFDMIYCNLKENRNQVVG